MPQTKQKQSDKDEARQEVLIRKVERDLADLDYKRAIKRVYSAGLLTQTELANSLGLTQPTVSYIVKTASDVQEPKEGLSGASPFEICQRYKAGELSRTELIRQLSKWPYAEPSKIDEYDSLVVDPPGTFQEVVRASLMGLIEDSVYQEILNHYAQNDVTSA